MTAPRRLVAAALALTFLAGVGALVLRRLDRTRPVTVDEAVDRFRASHPPSATVAPGATPTTTLSNAPAGPSPTASGGPGTTGGTRLPSRAPGGGAAPHDRRTPEGVYVYATTGYETADAGVPQARHDYPADTTMTVTHEAGCGSHIRWDATADRWDDVRDCVSSTSSVTTEYTTYHRFFGQEERRDYRCGPTAYLRPPPGTTRWTFDCATADGKARTHTDARIVGTERMTVGGAGVEALHVSFGTTLTGSSRGSNPVEYWLALNEPYVLRKTWRVDADVTTDFGTITYHEEYDVRLTSRTPRR